MTPTETKTCELCGGPLREFSVSGVCARNPECKKEGQRRGGRAYYHNHPEKQNEWRKNNPESVILPRIRHRAKVKGLAFTIVAEDILPVPGRCPCCDRVLLKSEKGYPDDNSPSLDRIIPELGYIPGNVRWLCQRCNKIKGDASPGEIMRIALFMQKDLS